jgi:hypothetical protein
MSGFATPTAAGAVTAGPYAFAGAGGRIAPHHTDATDRNRPAARRGTGHPGSVTGERPGSRCGKRGTR